LEVSSFRLTELNPINPLRPVPVPLADKAEQCRIVSELAGLQREIDRLRQLHAETAGELHALLPAVLNAAFKGEL
jgi:type I restriction enzyme, S subunit